MRGFRQLDGELMPSDDRHEPVKRKRATQECDPPGIAGGVCDGLSWRRSNPSASYPFRQFGAFPHASKNSGIGARRTLACASDPRLRFTLNHYRHTRHIESTIVHEPISLSLMVFGYPQNVLSILTTRPRLAHFIASVGTTVNRYGDYTCYFLRGYGRSVCETSGSEFEESRGSLPDNSNRVPHSGHR